MPVDRLAVATQGFRSLGPTSNRRLCIATQGFRCPPAPSGQVGGAGLGYNWCPPEFERPFPIDKKALAERMARAVQEAAQRWEEDARHIARNLAVATGLHMMGDGHNPYARLAAVCFLVITDDADETLGEPEDDSSNL